MELHSRKMIVQSLTEQQSDQVRVQLRDETGTAGAMPGAGAAGGFAFPIAKADAPKIGDEITITAATAV